MPWHQILGNNDCAAAPYKTVFPECPLYWSFARGGILFVGLHGYSCWKVENTNHAGIRYDEEQLSWLRRLVGDSDARTLVLFTHEPLLCDDSHLARAQLAPVLSAFRGEEIWNVAGHEHRNHTAAFVLGGRLVRSVETMTPVGEWKVGKGCFRRFRCAGGRIVGSELHWTDTNGVPLEVTEDAATRNAKSIVLLEAAFADKALSVCLVGRDSFELTGETVRIQDRLSNYYVCRPDSATHGPGGRLSFAVPREVKGRAIRSVVLLTGIGEKRYDLPPVGEDARTVVCFENTSTREIKIFGYALYP